MEDEVSPAADSLFAEMDFAHRVSRAAFVNPFSLVIE
jgi:hypothetical protein